MYFAKKFITHGWWAFRFAAAMFLHGERQHLREAWVQIYKFNTAAIFQRCEDTKRLFGHSVVCEKAYSLRQLKPKKGTLRKQLTVNSLPSNLFKKSFFYLHLIDQLIYWLKHFDSRNTYLCHP